MNKTFETCVLSKKENIKRGITIFFGKGEDEKFSRHKSNVRYRVLKGSIVIETLNDYFPLSAGQEISFPAYTYYRKIGDAVICALDNPPFDIKSLEELK